MKFVDASVLVRIITNDAPDLAAKARRVVAAAKPGSLMLLDAVLGEACYILEFNPLYTIPRTVVHQNLTDLISLPAFQTTIESKAALALYGERHELDYIDCLLLGLSYSKKTNLLTCDKTLWKQLS